MDLALAKTRMAVLILRSKFNNNLLHWNYSNPVTEASRTSAPTTANAATSLQTGSTNGFFSSRAIITLTTTNDRTAPRQIRLNDLRRTEATALGGLISILHSTLSLPRPILAFLFSRFASRKYASPRFNHFIHRLRTTLLAWARNKSWQALLLGGGVVLLFPFPRWSGIRSSNLCHQG